MLFANKYIGNQVINEFNLDEEQLSNFTQPRSYHQYFCRSIITEMNVNQLNLFDVVVQYTNEDNDTTRKKNSLIMYLEANPNLQGISYIEIWCQLAHKFYITQQKTLIPHSELERIRQLRVNQILNLQNHLQQNVRHRQQNVRNIIIEEVEEGAPGEQQIIQYGY